MSGEWLDNLKPGDRVIVDGGSGLYPPSVCKVERLTATQIVLDGGGRFRRTNGSQVGVTGWTIPFLSEATPERIAEIVEERRRRRLLSLLHKADWSSYSTEKLEEIVNTMNPPRPPANHS